MVAGLATILTAVVYIPNNITKPAYKQHSDRLPPQQPHFSQKTEIHTTLLWLFLIWTFENYSHQLKGSVCCLCKECWEVYFVEVQANTLLQPLNVACPQNNSDWFCLVLQAQIIP